MKVVRDPELRGYAFLATGPFDLAEATIKANLARTWYNGPINAGYWIGKHFSSWPDVMKALTTPDTQAVEEVHRMMDEFRTEVRELPITIKRKRNWNKTVGNVSVSRAIGGNPNFMYRFNRQKHTGPKNVVIIYNSDAAGGQSPDSFRWGGIACCAIVDLLEDAGYLCEIWVTEGGRASFRDRECPHSFTTAKIKDSGDALDLDLLAKVFSPWYLRTAIFGAKLAVPEEADMQSLGYVWPAIQPWEDKYMEASIGVIKVRIPFTYSKELALMEARKAIQAVTNSQDRA
jgi:hypothetical protein